MGGEHNPGPYLVKEARRDHKGSQMWAIVQIPSEPGRYMRTHPCVLEVRCPHCGAELGEPCRRKPLERGSIVRLCHGRAVVIEKTRTRHRQAIHKARRAAAGRTRRTNADGVEVPRREQSALSYEWGADVARDLIEITPEDVAK